MPLLEAIGIKILASLIVSVGAKGGKPLITRLREELGSNSAADERLKLLEEGKATSAEQAALAQLIVEAIQANPAFGKELSLIVEPLLEGQTQILNTLAQIQKQADQNFERLVEMISALLNRKPDAVLARSRSFDPPKVIDDQTLQRLGYTEEKRTLCGYLQARSPQVVQLVGKRGVGKTALAGEAVLEIVGENYVRLELGDVTAERVAKDLYEIFYNQPAPVSDDPAPVVGAVIQAWRARGCLLIIENLHVLLTSEGGTDHAVPPKPEAAAMLKQLSEAGPPLLITGWPGTSALGDHSVTIRLKGISPEEGAAVLKSAGVTIAPETITLTETSRRLNGNPGMLMKLAGWIREGHGGDARIMDADEDLEWLRDQARFLGKMWEVLNAPLQNALGTVCVLRREGTLKRLAALLEQDETTVRHLLETLIRWGHVVYDIEHKEYRPDHDLTREMVRLQMDGKRFADLHRRAAEIWLAESANIGKDDIPTTQAEIQPLLEAGYHLAEAGDGKKLVQDVLAREFGDLEFHMVAERVGAWADLTYLTEHSLASEAEPKMKAALIHNLGISYQKRGDWDEAMEKYEESMKIKQQIGDAKGVAQSLHQIGRVYQLQGQWDEALEKYEESLKIKQRIGDMKGVAASLHQIGMVYQDQGRWDEALEKSEESLKIKRQIRNVQGVAASLHQIGIVYQLQGKWDEALEKYKESLQILTQIGDVQGAAASLHQIGNIYYLQGKLEQALEKFEESLKIKQQIGDVQGAAQSLHQIGMVYHRQGKWNEALQKCEESLKIMQQSGDVQGQATSLHQIGMVYQDQGKWDEALEKYKESLKIAEQMGDVQGVAQTLHQIGRVYQLQGKWDMALEKYEGSLKIFEQIGDVQGVAESHGQMGVFFIRQQKYQEALEYTLKSLVIFLKLGDPRAKKKAEVLRFLRNQWGAEEFDAEWKRLTGGEVPEGLKKGEGRINDE